MSRDLGSLSDDTVERTANAFALGSLVLAVVFGVVSLFDDRSRRGAMGAALSCVALAAALRKV